MNKLVSLIGGPAAAALAYLWLPEVYTGISGEEHVFPMPGRAAVAVLVWMAVWWFFETVHVAATSLLPLALFPLFEIGDIKTTASAYGSHIVFLLLGGALIGLCMQRWGLDKRIALLILSRIGSSPARLVLGFMLISAVLSAFISNTATTAMMLPIAMNVILLLDQQSSGRGASGAGSAGNFSICVLLGLAYASSLGGITTVIGTAPNAYAVAFIQDALPHELRLEIGFVDWSLMALPVTLTMLPLTWLLLTRVIYPVGSETIAESRGMLRRQFEGLPPIGRGGWQTLAVFALAVVLWIARPHLQQLEITLSSESFKPLSGLSDPGIAMLAAVLLFALPAGGGRFTLNWDTAKRLPWEIVFLFGGGIALARAIKAHGVDQVLGAQAAALIGLPEIVIVMAVVALVVFLTEFASNTATTAALVPIFAALAAALGLDPVPVAVATAFAASCAFMMPVATPPNAIVFSSGRLRIQQMVRAGFVANLLVIPVITGVVYFLVGRVLGV